MLDDDKGLETRYRLLPGNKKTLKGKARKWRSEFEIQADRLEQRKYFKILRHEVPIWATAKQRLNTQRPLLRIPT